MSRTRYSPTKSEHHGRKSRAVGYEVVVADGVGEHAYDEERRVEQLLIAALADGTVTQWDGNRGHFWWNGPPGDAMRALRDAIGGETVRREEDDPIRAAARRIGNRALAP